MPKDVKTLTLRFSIEKHAKLVKLKEKMKASSWEDFIEKITGIDKK